MKNTIDLSTLESRPPWQVVKWLKTLTIVIFALAILMIIAGLITGYIYMQIPSEGETSLEAFYGAVSSTLENAGYYGIGIGFYALIMWLTSQAVDRIDQLVWLNANASDRMYIYNKRLKKNAKNK